MTTDLELIDGGDPIRLQAATWFARLRADDVSEADRRQWQAWANADHRHRTAYERLERLWSSLGEHAPAPDIGRRLATAVRSDAPATASARRRPRRWIAALAVAAAVAMAAVGAWTLLPVDEPALEYVTAIGEQRRMTLEDGTRVTLDTGTRLRVEYSERERRLILDQGRAFFEVAKEARPLFVQTVHGDVRAVGTQFEVYRHEGDMEVLLVEGKVMLSTGDGAGTAVAMLAGHKARLGPDHGNRPLVEALPGAGAPPWLSGRLVFDDASLREVVDEFNRYSHRQIVLTDARLSDVHITGVFRNDGMHAFLGALRDAYPILVDTSTPGLVRLQPVPTGEVRY
jgi:transmembrane sensor